MCAVVVAENAASLAVATRLGMAYEGPTGAYYGGTLDLYSLAGMTKAPARTPGPS